MDRDHRDKSEHLISIKELEIRLTELLRGGSFTHIEYDDYWQMATNDNIWVTAHSLFVSFEADVERALAEHIPRALETVDPGIVPTASGLFALLRRPIDSVSLSNAGELEIHIGFDLIRTTIDVDTVDWQWSVSKNRSMPYRSFEIACFGRDDVREMNR